MNIVARIDHWGEHIPDHLAHLSAHRRLTYGELKRQSDLLATHLLHQLPEGNAPVIVRGHKEPEMLVAFLAVLKSGRAYIPVDISLPEARLTQIAETSQCALILTPDEVLRLLAAPAPPSILFPARQMDDSHYIIFTSGSTGTPKGVIITSRNLSTFLSWMLAEQALEDRQEVFLNQAPFSFDLSVMDLYLSLVTGGTLASVTKDETSNLKAAYTALARPGLTTWVSTPSFAQLCLADSSFRQDLLPTLRRFLFCGETLPPFVAGQLLERFPLASVWNTYGPTEATVAMTSIRIDQKILSHHSSLPVGFPMPGVQVLISDENGVATALGQAGEIVICGDNVSNGYLGRPDLTEKSFTMIAGRRAYKTGDWGHLNAEGLLFVSGRMDGQIKLAGHRIELGDIEANLRELPDVRDAVVLPVTKDHRTEMLAAFVAITTRSEKSDLELMLHFRGELSHKLPAYMIPKRFVFLDSFPMTPNGKADRKKLGELL